MKRHTPTFPFWFRMNRIILLNRFMRLAWVRTVLYSIIFLLLTGCISKDISIIVTEEGSDEDADKLLIVDCLLPGRIKRLGQSITYVTARRPAKLTALDCGARGGEYVAYDQANSATALKVWLAAAQDGDKVAQVYVGEIYEKGFGIKPDYKLAAIWYKRSANQGYARAKLNLGYLYEQGFGVEKDLGKALRLYRDASGLNETEIEFVASIDAVTVASDVQDLRKLKIALEDEKQRIATLEKQTQQTKDSLAEQQREIKKQNKILQTEREELARKKRFTLADKQKIKQLKQQLEKRERVLEGRRQEALKLTARLSRYLGEVKKLPGSRNMISLAGPSIQLISPALINIRGLPEININPKQKTRELLGKVTAASGLKIFTINEKQTKVDVHGGFRILIPINEKRTSVTIMAIDEMGKSTKVEFTIVQRIAAKTVKYDVAQSVPARDEVSNFGNFHALVIGNNAYAQFPKLQTAINDAKSVAAILSAKYGYKTTTLINAKRFIFLAALNRLGKKLTKQDNLLIYYAGHGELSDDGSVGYWLPVDAGRDNKRKWVSNMAISDIINSLPVKRVLVIADSCYSGALTRSSLPQLANNVSGEDRLIWLRAVAKSTARLAFTSGGLKPVADIGANDHSIFANALLEVLEKNSGILEGQRLYQEVAARILFNPMARKIGQIPQYAPIKHAGHESGEFFFLPTRVI